MSDRSTTLERSSQWDEICFPVSTVQLSSLLPGEYALLANDRRMAIVGETVKGRKNIYALQSEEYSLIPNSLLRSVLDDCVNEYSLDIQYTDRGEFSIHVILPDMISIGDERLYKSMIINNSYSGKAPFTLQGTVINARKETSMRVSYYRKICKNGLMGWVDDFMSMDDYLQWLLAGKPKKYQDAKEVKTTVKEDIVETKKVLLNKKFSHRQLDLDWFSAYLQAAIMRFLAQESALTAQVYERLGKKATPDEVQPLMIEIGLPKMLAREAEARLRQEEKELKTDRNMWLLYNAINYALFNSRTSLNINDRYLMDEKALHHLTTLTV
jgi:hypothetical protein